MPKNTTQLVNEAKRLQRLQTERRKLRKRLKDTQTEIRLVKKNIRALSADDADDQLPPEWKGKIQ